MATKFTLKASALCSATACRGRRILVTALYPAHPYRARARVVVPQKLKSHSANTAVADPKPTRGVSQKRIDFQGLHHVGLLIEDLDRSLNFYCGTLGLNVNPDRPDDKLPYDGAWLWIGPEMVHLMVLPNPDPLEGRPEHGGRDRHCCIGVASITPLEERLAAAGISYTRSKSGRPAIFFRDPDMNVLEVVQTDPWR